MAQQRSNGRRDNRTGSIYKDGTGWRVQILLRYDRVTGKPVIRKARAKTHAEAVEVLEQMQREAGTHFMAAPTGLSLGDYLDRWLEIYVAPSKAPKTQERYRWAVDVHIKPHLGRLPVNQVSRLDVQALIASMAKTKTLPKLKDTRKNDPKPDRAGKPGPKPKPVEAKTAKQNILSRRTIESVVAVLRTAFESAIRDGVASTNPVSHVSLPPNSLKQAEFLNPGEVTELLRKLESSPISHLVKFMLATGCRLGEATGIRWQDFDLERGFVRISGQLQRLEGKLEYRATTKTNQDRTLTLSAWHILELKEMRIAQQVNGFDDPDGIAFLNQFGRRLDPKFVNNELAKICTKAKIKAISAHKLRHTAATLALMETGDLHGVQKLLGHQQVALTSNLYGHATAERLRPITDALGKLLRPG